MKKLSRTLLCLTCTLAIGVAALSGCANNSGTTLSQYEGDVVHYSSSDAGLANFLNDFTRRNLRFDEESIAAPESTLGNGTGFAKNWETMGLVWHNSAGKVLGENKLEKLETFLRTITQDGQGMIYNTHNNLMAGRSQAGDGISQGWPFPTHNNSGGRSTAFEFNYATEQASWSVSQGGTLSVGTDGYARFTYSAPSAGSAFRMTNSSFRTVNAGGIDTKHAPIVEIELAYVDANHAIGSGTDVAEVSLIFQTESGGDTWYRAPQSLYATTPVTLGYALNERMYFSMYLHENWDGEIVTALGIEISAKDGKTLKLTDGKINYIRPGYDTRQSNATYQFILALGNYVAYTNNNAFLEEMLPKARRAVLFLTHALEGEDGLLDISYLYGHNGIGSSTEDGKLVRNIGDGIGNGYWDILTAPEKNLEANTYFYQALGVMADLERRAAAAGIESAAPSVKNRIPGEAAVVYDYTADSLEALQREVKGNMEQAVNPVQLADGTWENQGGFWSQQAGRFVSGIRKDNGAVIDYGFVYWNEEAIAAGIGTEAQRNSIMSWINGSRTVAGDTSTGEDLYFYEFAPRFSTKANTLDYGFYYSSPGYSKQVQDGGAVICWSYYDLISRLNVLGADNAYDRLKGIQTWYEAVQAAGGSGSNFYNDYYMYLENGSGVYVLQQSGAQNGAMGLDSEFLESIILQAAVPYGFFGMDGSTYNTQRFTNNLPNAMDWWQIDNMLYSGVTYSVRMEKGMLRLLNVDENVPEGLFVELCFAEPSGAYTVTVNGAATSAYTVAGGMVTVRVPFGNVEVRVG